MNTIIKPDIAEKFNDFLEFGRVIFFCAACGFGKTTTAKKLLKNKRVCSVSAEKPDFEKIDCLKWDIMLIDDLQLMKEREDEQRLCDLIKSNADKRFVLLSRGQVPGWLIPFKLSGLMITISADELFFDRNSAKMLFDKYKLHISESELSKIMRNSQGYPLVLSIICRRMCQSGGEYNEKISNDVLHELYIYYEEAVFLRLENPYRRFLLDLAPFEKFNAELAKMASGSSEAEDILINIRQNTNMLIHDGRENFHFWKVFRNFLMWEQKKEYSVKQQQAIYSRGALYFELKNQFGEAIEYYTKSGETDKVSEILIKSTYLHPGMGHYENMEKYCFALPEKRIAESPALMQEMSMLHALRADYEESDRWYRELESFAAERRKGDAAAREAKERLIWLDVALPQRGVTDMVDIIKRAFKLISNKEIKMQPLSVTSALPSIMNGGKDFSDWSKKDDFLYATIRLPVEVLLGRDVVGLPECAIAESKFEKGDDSKMLSLVSKIADVQNKGTPDIEFAIVGLVARWQIVTGNAEDAIHALNALKKRFCEMGHTRFNANIDAMLCRIALRLGDAEGYEEWYKEKAPRTAVTFRAMKRYLYFTKAMTELAAGKNENAIMTLSLLENYCRVCKRHIDGIHLMTLRAVAKYRMGDNAWKEDILLAIESAREYGFVRTITQYGIAVLPLLTECGIKDEFTEKLIKEARRQAVLYPDFLRNNISECEKLTESEMQVLRLLCRDKSNAEIGEILDIKLATVKSHVSHVLQKLGVKRRNEAKTAAKKLRIISF